MQYFGKFSLLFGLFSSKKPTRKQVKISNFIVMLFVSCNVATCEQNGHGIKSVELMKTKMENASKVS